MSDVVPPMSTTTEFKGWRFKAAPPMVLAAGPENTVSHGLIRLAASGIVPPSAFNMWRSQSGILAHMAASIPSAKLFHSLIVMAV